MSWYEWIYPALQDMSWQDWTLAATQLLFIGVLMPTVLDKEQKPTFFTSAATAFGCVIMVVTMATLGMVLTPFFMSINGLQWAVLAWQRRQLNKIALSRQAK